MSDREIDLLIAGSITDDDDITIITKQTMNNMKTRSHMQGASLPEIIMESSMISFFDEEDLVKQTPHIFDPEGTGTHSLFDGHMGVSEHHPVCLTCGLPSNACQGHLGHFCARKKFYHPLPISNGEIVQVLQSVCQACGELLLTKQDIKNYGIDRLTGPKRLERIADRSEDLPCGRLARFKAALLRETENNVIKQYKQQAGLQDNEAANVMAVLNQSFVEGTPEQQAVKNPSEALSLVNRINNLSQRERIVYNDVLAARQAAEIDFSNKSKEDQRYQPCRANPPLSSAQTKKIRKVAIVKKKGKGKSKTDKGDKDQEVNFISIDRVWQTLDAISDETARMLGFANGTHPRRMICRVFPILAPQDRPPNQVNGDLKPHAITQIYRKILLCNLLIPDAEADTFDNRNPRCVNTFNNRLILKQVGETKSISRTKINPLFAYDMMVEWIHALVENPAAAKVAGSSGQFSGMTGEIQSKTGTIRGNIMGKRVDKVARSILSPGPNLRFGTVGIPREFAKDLVKKVTINQYNIEAMQRLIDQGCVEAILRNGIRYPIRYQNAVSAPLSGDIVSVTRQSQKKLRIGDVIERWLQDGDYVLLNRHPSLHRYGMMGHQVFLHDGKTILMHMSETTPYNADFDGDEGNLHSLQVIEAEAEIRYIMNAKENIMNPKFNRPIMGAVYDTLTGGYLMTAPGRKVDIETWTQCIEIFTNTDGLIGLDERLEKYSMPPYTGAALFSAMMPPDFYYIHEGVTIIDGILLEGRITSKHIGTPHNSIVQVLWKQYGRDRTVDFLTDVPRVINRWLESYGFSIGLKDCIVDRDYREDRITANIKGIKNYYQSVESEFSNKNSETRQEIVIRLSTLTLLSRTTPAFVLEKDAKQWFPYMNLRSVELLEATLRAAKLPIDYRDSRVLISVLLPEGVNVQNQRFIVEDGIFKGGYLNIADVQALVDAVYQQRPDAFLDFVTNTTFFLIRWFGSGSNFEGKVDLTVKQHTMKARLQVEALGAYPIDSMEREEYEKKVIGYVGDIRVIGETESAKSVDPNNAIQVMLSSGSKGGTLNLVQMVYSVGQQMLGGERLKPTMTGGTRCLPHFLPGDVSIEALGYCQNNLMNGLSPTESFYHQQASREGATDTAVKVSSTGTIQRLLMKVFEGVKVAFDGSVRNDHNGIIQYIYNDDGLNRGEMQNVSTPSGKVASFIDLNATANRLNARYGFNPKIKQ